MRVGMFLGVETYNWDHQQLLNAAYQMKASGIDTMIVKVADGKNTWYGDAVVALATLKGVIDVIPYQYCYGNFYGGLDREIAITNWLIDNGYTPMLDMEVEYNGRPDWCKYLVDRLHGQVHISTWADPDLQQWRANLQVLDSKTHLFFPQVYTSYLQGVWEAQYQAAGIALSKCVPTITPATISTASGRNAISMWEYFDFSRPQLLEVERDLVQEVVNNVNTNEQQKKQAIDCWAANTVGAEANTGIYGVYLDQFMNHNRDCGVPVSKEIFTCDWSGNPIVKQFFSQGVSIEWYRETQNGHTTGENHGYSLGGKLW